jgi:hypothetical protein
MRAGGFIMNNSHSEFDKAAEDAKKAEEDTKSAAPRKRFPWADIVLPLMIVAVLCYILFPQPHGSKVSARRVICVNNLKQIGSALMQYAQEYDETMPLMVNGKTADGKVRSWRQAPRDYIRDETMWKCPSNEASEIINPFDGLAQGYDTVDVGPIRYGKPVSLRRYKLLHKLFWRLKKMALTKKL